MRGGTLISLLPDEFLALFLVAAGLAMILGMRRIAISIVVFVLVTAISSPFISAFIETLPSPLLLLVLAIAAIAIFRDVVGLAAGEKKADRATQWLVIKCLKGVLLAPWRVLRLFLTPLMALFRMGRGG